MNKMIMIALAAFAVILTGCKSIEVERHAATLATDKNGEVVRSATGEPVVLDGGWSVDYFQHWNTQKFDALEAKAGQASLSINNYASSADTNLVALVTGSIDATTKLVSTCAAAYVTIAGGGAQADTATAIAAKIVSYFTSKGGDTDKAKVSTDAASGTLTVTDGTTAVQCKDGSCYAL